MKFSDFSDLCEATPSLGWESNSKRRSMNLIFKRYPLILIALFTLAVTSCTKTDGGGGGGGGSTTKGTITGSEVTYDDKGNQNADDKGNVKVEVLSGTTVLGTAITPTSGKYTLANIPYGTYTLRFSRNDIGTYKLFNVSHQYNSANPSQGTTVSTVQLGLLSTTEITGLTYTGNTYNSLPGAAFTLTVNPDPSTNSRAYFRVFLSTNANVSKDVYGVATELRSIISNNATIGFTKDEMTTLGLSSGQTAYIRVYGDSFQANVYTDPDTGKKVYPNLNEKTVAAASFIVP